MKVMYADLVSAHTNQPQPPRGYLSRGRALASGLAMVQSGHPGQVDTHHVVRLGEDHEDAATGPAADDGARSPLVDDEFTYWPAGAAGAADTVRGGHLRTKDVGQQAADRVAVHRVHQCPPVALRDMGPPSPHPGKPTSSKVLVGFSGPAEPLGLDAFGWITEPDKVLGDRLDEGGGPTDEREGMLAGWPDDLGQHRGI